MEHSQPSDSQILRKVVSLLHDLGNELSITCSLAEMLQLHSEKSLDEKTKVYLARLLEHEKVAGRTLRKIISLMGS